MVLMEMFESGLQDPILHYDTKVDIQSRISPINGYTSIYICLRSNFKSPGVSYLIN